MEKIIGYLRKCGGRAEFEPWIQIKKTPHSFPTRIKRCELIGENVFYETADGGLRQLHYENEDVYSSIGIRLYSMTEGK